MNDQGDVSFALSDRAKEAITRKYYLTAGKVAETFGVDLRAIRISGSELARALAEAEFDYKAMMRRRQSEATGLSASKFAGMLAFRLARFKIVHIVSDHAETKHCFLLQEAIALVLVFNMALKMNAPVKQVLELAYQLARRHANQETLALCFDAFKLASRPTGA
ncbi:hypothetical protein HHL28_00060 [Aerophototrophica crusticola]|uniref:Uncharacterized protein n=1 Tax=Aerophototrophica crusticola TaxID=1709002 RepID=A0A858R2V9_9PROT|nr:hypothetical protein HHL28_00060 [Rhodospirillaceae bacterium B3]